MRHGRSTPDNPTPHGVSRLRLRVGVLLILMWLIPFWALAPYIAHALNGPSVEAVTAVIVAVQTILGLLGFWVAGTEVRSIIKGSTMRHALAATWSILIHGHIPGQDNISADLDREKQPRDDSR
jgi:hypothetical protein